MIYLLDTDILIYLFKGNQRIRDNLNRVGDKNIIISAISVGELYFGAYHSQERERNLLNLKNIFAVSRIIPVDEEIAEHFGELKAELKSKGELISDSDLLIASTCLAQDAVLVTGNEKHFRRIKQLKIENWVK
jgi:tRNA(fMet)-specific endonuclease VapC